MRTNNGCVTANKALSFNRLTKSHLIGEKETKRRFFCSIGNYTNLQIKYLLLQKFRQPHD